MYNQVNRGTHLGQGSIPPVGLPPPPPPPPAYQQAPPPPPPHFQHFVPPPNMGGQPAPHIYLHGPPTTSSSFMPNAGPSYAIPSQMQHGNGMAPQMFSNPIGQNSQHSSNLGVQSHPIPPPVPPPIGHSHQETSWPPGPPPRVLPPPPSSSQGQILYNPPFHPPPSQPGDIQNLQRSHNTPPPPPPPHRGSGFLPPAPDGVYLHSNVGNYQVPSITPPPPPLPTSPPPVPPSPPPPAPPMTSPSSHAAHSDDPNSTKVSGFESKAVDSVDGVVASCPSGIAPVHNSDPNEDSGSCREVTVADGDELLSSRSVNLDLPPPPPQPREEKTVQKIKALCQLIAENGANIEDKVRQDEFQNPEYAFLFGGNPGTEAAISHTYFLWMKKKYNLEPRWDEKRSESQLRPLAGDSSGKQYHLHAASTVSADSDMEMEDDITLSPKDQGSKYAIETLTQQHDRGDEVFSMNKKIHKLQSSTEKDPAKGILSSGPGLLADNEPMKSATSVTNVHCPVNDSPEVAEFPLATVLERSSAPLDNDFIRNGTSDHNEVTNSNRDSGRGSGQLIRSGSPIRLLQDYASDDTSDNENERCAVDANVLTVSAGADTGVSAAHKDSKSYLETDIGSNSPSSTRKGLGLLSKTSQNDSEISPHLVQESKGTCKRSVSCTGDGCIENNLENQVSVNLASSIEAFQGKEGLSGAGIDSDHKSGDAEQEDENERKTSKLEQTVLKVDKFGRLPREGATDSDSDDSCYHQTRRKNKRDRSWSRSRSPPDRRRRRRSPRRRKDKRSRSRSWSPRRHRSRSRSPILRRSGDFRGENVRKDKGQCFAFSRGKCNRGASCRYIHHESDKNATSRRHRNKHDLEVYSLEKKSRGNEGMKNISSKMSEYEHDGVRSQDVDLCQNVIGQEVVQRKEDFGRHAAVSATFGLDGQPVSNPSKSEGLSEVAPNVQENLVVREEPKALIHENDSFQKAVNSHQQHLADGFHPEVLSSGDAFKPSGGTPKDGIPSEDGSFVQQVQSNISVGVPEHSGHPSQLLNVSFVTDLSSDKRSMVSASANKVSGSEPLTSTQLQSATSSIGPCVTSEQPSMHAQASKDLPPHIGSSVEFPDHTYQLPTSVVSHSQGENAVHMPQISRQYDMMQQNAFFPFQSTTREKFEPYPAPLHTPNSHFSVHPNSSWTSLPPPPPPPPSQAMYNSSSNMGVAKSFISSEFNQSQLHSRTDFVSQTSMNPGLSTHSQSSKFHDQAYPPMQDHSRTFMLTEPFSPNHLPRGNPACQSLPGPNLNREDHCNQLSMQDTKFSSSTSFSGLHPQPKQFSWESDVNRLQPSLGSMLPPEGHFKTSSHIHPLSQKQQSVYSFQYSASDVNLGVPGETVTVSRYPPDVLDSNHSTSLPSFGVSRISAHYNPYASTFEQPLSSKFSSSIFRQENDIIHENTCGSSRLNHTPINREGDGIGSRQSASLPKPARAVVGQILPRSGGEQYDPLFDSIEPSSSLKKFDFDQKQEVTGESNISLRPKSSYMSLDMEEKKLEEVGAVASTTSQTNDEYGETADAEVGAVENESLSNHVDVANMTSGEVEINQIKSPGKRKKSKDSRSMKLFKVSIANFVKEVLKPSWRQGNMSKVAFKTIVKKTVDKVSGAMKGHRVPKSQAKISQYIDSSQRKLTKLVMGYVDKYVKV